MSKFTKYQSSWEKDRPWLAPVSDDIYKAHCKACCSDFFIRQNGIDKIKQHEKRNKHITAIKNMPNQCSIISVSGSLQLSKSPLQESFNIEQQVAKAEVLQAIHVVTSNHSFSSTNGDNKRFRLMFPDSKIAEKYSQQADKTRYVIVYGIAPYVKDLPIKDARNSPFCYKFDETTTSQVKNNMMVILHISVKNMNKL